MAIIQIAIVCLSAIVAAVFVVKKFLDFYWGRCKPTEEENVRDKTVLITGAGSGVGFETAVEMASRGATVIITGRSMKAVRKTVEDIRNRTFLGTLIPMVLELGSLESVRTFCTEFRNNFEHIDILINNAGVLIPPAKGQTTMDGFEMHFGVNHLGHFLLTTLLLPLLKKAKSCRVVVVASVGHRGYKLNFGDLMFERTEIPDVSPTLPNPLYAHSKLANVLFAQELAKRVEGTNIRVYTCCPGCVQTNIGRHLDMPVMVKLLEPIMQIMLKTSNQGCQTVLYCALSKAIKNESGQLYRHCAPWTSSFAFPDDLFMPWADTVYSDEDAKKLWTESEKLCRIK